MSALPAAHTETWRVLVGAQFNPTLFCRLACGIIARSAGLFQNPKQNCSCDGLTIWEERGRPIAGQGRKEPAQPPAHL